MTWLLVLFSLNGGMYTQSFADSSQCLDMLSAAEYGMTQAQVDSATHWADSIENHEGEIIKKICHQYVCLDGILPEDHHLKPKYYDPERSRCVPIKPNPDPCPSKPIDSGSVFVLNQDGTPATTDKL